jgi:tRNA(fMet)-specific endonuclease VapC
VTNQASDSFGGGSPAPTLQILAKALHKRQREDRMSVVFSPIWPVRRCWDLTGAELAGRICGDLERTGQPIGLADAMIAAPALQHNLTLVTGNISHYQRIQGLGYSLKLDNWRT